MGKKGKRQSDPEREDCCSTDDEQKREQDNQNSCPHTGKAVSLGAIKKNLKISWVRVGQCAPCLRERKTQNRPAGSTLPRTKPGAKKTLQEQKREQLERARQEQIEAAAKLKSLQVDRLTDDSGLVKDNQGCAAKAADAPPAAVVSAGPAVVWLCLKCGSQACGETGSGKGHCRAHYTTPRSELHCLFVNTDSWNIYCFECQKDIFFDSHKKLYEAVEFVKKTNTKPNKQVTGAAAIPMKAATGQKVQGKLTGKEMKDQANVALQSGLLPKVKGLTNLGNTCFFNSVLQCLSQTHPLTQYLDTQTSKGANLHLQVLDEKESILSEDENDNLCTLTVPQLSIQLPEGGPMMTSLAAFLKDMHSAGKTSTITPSHLFGQVVKQSPKFRGMQQQDSQELLRYLMDGLRSEEAKRQKSAVLRHFGLTEKTDPNSVSRPVRTKLKLYGRTSSHTLLDKIFSGQMVSTIVCEECHFSSQTFESFLDLSLPVVEDKPHKPRGRSQPQGAVLPDDDDNVRVSCCGVQEEKRSKGQMKKEKLRKKKESRKNRNKSDKCDAKMEENETGAVVKDISVITGAKHEAVELSGASPTTPLLVQMARKLEKNGGSGGGSVGGEYEKRRGEQKTSWKDGGGGEDDEEEEGYEEGEEDWEWDYGETWEEEGTEKEKGDKEKEEDGTESDYVEISRESVDVDQCTDDKPTSLQPTPLCSLNPLPAELIGARFEHEKSSEPTATNTDDDDDDDETGASSNGDVEDNNSDASMRRRTILTAVDSESSSSVRLMQRMAPIEVDPSKVDPHMERLCNGIRLLGTKMATDDKSTLNSSGVAESLENMSEAKQKARLQNEWTARTLVSLGPRYTSSSGECSVYSCLHQFTQSELLTGSNKWACDNCTNIRYGPEEKDVRTDPDEEVQSCESSNNDNGSTDQPPRKTVYSNASKQFLVFCPPLILTLHLKRFQQTLVGCRKLNKHVTFPLLLDLAPFCSSTCLAMPLMPSNQSKVLYSLYGVVEHSGRLQGGHYTAFVKVRPANTSPTQQTSETHLSTQLGQLFAPPVSRPTDIPRLLAELQRKCSQQWPSSNLNHVDNASMSGAEDEQQHAASSSTTAADNNSTSGSSSPRRWFHVSDTNVSEVSEEKVLKAQAYLLFYERVL